MWQDIKLSSGEYRRFADLIYQTAGINLGSDKQGLLKTRFQKIMRIKDIRSFREYYTYVVEDKTGTAFSEMIDAISTNHTFFFREKDHFDYLQQSVLPTITAKKRMTRRNDIRVWCAASSSGEEPYTIGMVLQSSIDLRGWDVKVLATDISKKVLLKAQAGCYSANQIKNAPLKMVQEYFQLHGTKQEGYYAVKPLIKNIIAFRHFNLMTKRFPFKGTFDCIFCRNVLIYFDSETQHAVLSKMLMHLESDGYIFLGHAETMPNQLRHQVRVVGPAVFQKK